ncbi:MAG: tetratricopeptide repeat protein [Sulfuricella denitrificans]|nr:tetratricopeptide repeat protein [Sulfuricella denitrificans]
MKALKKAEESQQGVQGEKAPTLQELEEELSLEPRQHETSSTTAAAKPGDEERSPAYGTASAQGAANLFAAKAPEGSGRKGLLLALSAAALLLLAGGGTYVYLAINKPGLLISFKKASPPPLPSLPAQKPEPSPAVAEPPPPKEEAAPGAMMAAPVAPETQAILPAPTAVLAEAKNRAPQMAMPAPDGAVRVVRDSPPEINPDLAKAYQALQEGRLEAAQSAYRRLLQQEPRSVDGLLGMAAVAARSSNPEEAGSYYLRVLDVEPRNTYAQAGLLNLLGSTDPAGSEAKLKRLLASQPSASLYFVLGNLYATEGRWPDAQQAYFQAHHMASTNPDYAFNLAVSLEHLKQPKQALTYYQLALQLIGREGVAAFDRTAAEARIVQLKRMAE